ncbi:hypothetical protein HN011_008267 [Eciton burchellii]|nr:hypothetical protein HN011_008267 [Eciton burchellii]
MSRTIKKRLHLGMHLCDLPTTSGSNLPRLPPNAKFYSRWKRNLQKLLLISARHPLTPLVLRSQAAIAFEKNRHSRSAYRWMIHPYSMLRFYWETLMLLVFLYIFLTVPYILAFNRIGKSYGAEQWKVVTPVWIISIFDIAFYFITGYVSKTNQIFFEWGTVVRHYLKGYFVVDLISSVPYIWFHPIRILPPGPNSNSEWLLLEFLLVLKIARISTVRHYINQINIQFRFSVFKRTIIWLIILTLLIFHWSSCLTYVFPYIILHIKGETVKDIFYITAEIYNKPPWKVYIIYTHIGVSNLISSNFMEFDKFGFYDKSIRTILLLLGKIYTIYLIVTILKILESLSEPKAKFQRMLHQIKEHISKEKFPPYLQKRLLTYYKYRYQDNFFQENIIYHTLSTHLNQEILFQSSRGLLETVILQNLPRYVLGDLINSLRLIIYIQHDIIYTADTESDSMYFIASGTVALITFSGQEICHLYDGDHFGEIGLIFPDQRRTESVIALEVCELLRLHRRDFKYLFDETSEFYNNLEKIAQTRLKKIEELEGL